VRAQSSRADHTACSVRTLLTGATLAAARSCSHRGHVRGARGAGAAGRGSLTVCAAGDDAGPAPGDAWRKAARRWPQAPTAGLRLDPVTAQLLDEAKDTRAPKQRTTPLPVVEQTDLTAVAASTTPALAAPATAAAGAQVMVILMGIPGSGECVSASQLRVVQNLWP